MKCLAFMLGLVLCIPFQAGAQVRPDTARRIVIPVERAVDDQPTGALSGQTNIFFSPVPESGVDSVRMAKE